MERKEFQAESKRLLELMIHSIYTHKEIFLREILSNASDAIDKLCYRSLTDEQVGMKREDFAITIRPDQEARTLTVSDNGIGMNDTDLEQNLGVIASSGTFQFRQELDKDAESDVIGQFGVGFYSAFMVADHITVVTRKYGDEQGWRWESDGVEGSFHRVDLRSMHEVENARCFDRTQPHAAREFGRRDARLKTAASKEHLHRKENGEEKETVARERPGFDVAAAFSEASVDFFQELRLCRVERTAHGRIDDLNMLNLYI